MKIIKKIGEAIFVQTHAEKPSVWVHLGKQSFPIQNLSQDGSSLLGWDYHLDQNVKIPLLDAKSWESAEDWINQSDKQPELLKIDAVLKILPLSRSSFLQGVKTGRYPKALKIGAKSVAWLKSDIEDCIKSMAQRR